MERFYRWLDRWLATPILRWLGMPKPKPKPKPPPGRRPVSHLVLRVGPRGGPDPEFLCGGRRLPGEVSMILPNQVTCPACLEQLVSLPQPSDDDDLWADMNREP